MYILLLSDSAALSKAQRAIELDYSHRVLIERAADWRHVRNLVASETAQLVIFDPYLCGELNIREIGEFHAAFPSIVLVAYGMFSQNVGDSIAELVANGVHGVVTRNDGDEAVPFAKTLQRAAEYGFKNKVLWTFRNKRDAKVISVLSFLLDNTKLSLTPDIVARYAHCHPNSLRSLLRRSGLPPIGAMIVWTRLFHSAFLLDDPGRKIERVAYTLNYPSAADMGNQLRRRLGISPSELRRSGGLELILAHFHKRYGPTQE